MAPHMIKSHRAPHLAPVGSLTNLLTDLSSTGFRKIPKDMNKEIPKIMANNAQKRKQQISMAKVNKDYDLHNATSSQRQTGLSRFSGDEGLHFYSPKVEKAMNHYFTQA